MLVSIKIEKLTPHSDNPRKNLGDLTELAESIKAQGILQNLTIVPEDPEKHKKDIASKHAYTGNYTVVIGHRRLEAAKLAELTELPCTISYMDTVTQVATMLLENIQRNDLTVYEQSRGFQMMLDLGCTIEDISNKIGFSKTTVRRRTSLLELNPDSFKAAEERGGTLQDYADLEKIEDTAIRNSVLEKVGTSNFRNALQNAIDNEKKEKRKKKVVAELEKFAKPTKSTNDLHNVQYFWLGDSHKIETPNDTDTVNYFYTVDNCNITLYCDKAPKRAERVLTEKEIKEKERMELLREISTRMFTLRYEFIKGLAVKKTQLPAISEYTMNSLICRGNSSFEHAAAADLLGVGLSKKKKVEPESLAEMYAQKSERVLLCAAYCATNDSARAAFYDWRGEHNENNPLVMLYDLLVKLGYEMSDEEKSMRDGSHELFTPPTSDDEEALREGSGDDGGE
jgi:ParB family chromosome partitioning protein